MRIPRAVSARYDRKTRRIVVRLSSGLIVSFSPRDVEGLEDVPPSQLSEIEISPSGFGLHFPTMATDADADIYLPGLLEGFLGSKTWMASRLGQIGGRSKSADKQAASKANGKLGGRPRKAASLINIF